jgi:hypothetical protein
MVKAIKSAELVTSSTAADTPSGGNRRRSDRLLRWRPAYSLLVYGIAGLAAQWPVLPGNPSQIRQGDQTQNTWNLAWTPYALLHGHAIFYTNAVNYPRGMNLGQNNLAPFLGLLTMPLTLAANPISSLNLLIWLAFPISAFAMYMVVRQVVGNELPAFVAGALYGFSPYMVGQGLDHMIIDIVPIPPIIFLALYELFVRQNTHVCRWGIALGVLVTIQFYISAEIAATSVLIALIALVVLAVSHPKAIGASMRHGIRGLLVGIPLALAATAYPIWVTLAGPYHVVGSAHSGGLAADLYGSIFPTVSQQFAPSEMINVGMRLVGGDYPENGSFIGIPLILILGFCVVRYRRNRWIQFGAVMLIITIILSFGTQLEVDGHLSPIKLPLYLVAQLPLFDNILAARLSLYVWMFIPILVALGIRELQLEVALSARPRATIYEPSRWRALRLRGSIAALVLVSLAAAASLIPRWPYQSGDAGVPSYFTSKAVDAIKPGEVALISPYPSAAEVAPELWQAMSRMRFRMIGGYGIFTDPNGAADTYPAVTYPKAIESYLWSTATGGTPSDYRLDVKVDTRALKMDLIEYLRRNDVGVVLWVNGDANPTASYQLFASVLGKPSVIDGPVDAWYSVRQVVRGS